MRYYRPSLIRTWVGRALVLALVLYVGGHAVAMAGDDPCAPVEERIDASVERVMRTAQSVNTAVVGATLNAEPPSALDVASDTVKIAKFMHMLMSKLVSAVQAVRDRDVDKIRGVLLMRGMTPGGCNPVHPPCETIAGDTGGRLATSGIAVDTARDAATAAGFTGADLEIAVAIAGAESAYRPDALGTNPSGTQDHGLWQINSVHADLLAAGDWRDPATNARMAHAVWERAGGSWTPWTTYTSGAYKSFLAGGTTTAAGCIDVVPGVETATRWAQRAQTSATPTSCAAFVAGAWGAANTVIPDTPAELFASVAPIAEGQERPGDIRFADFTNAQPGQVGLILPGGKTIAAPCAGGPATTTDYSYAGDARYGRVKATPRVEQAGGPKGWGGHANGQIPESAMCAPKTAPAQRLHCDAAAAFDQLSAAYTAQFGTPPAVTGSYRSLQGQIATKRAKPTLAATPGKSDHGWGLAVDLGGGIQTFGSPQHEWTAANAPTYGWVLPSWAQRGGSKPEPWHFEYQLDAGAGA
jgi:hypothetical protein